MSARWSQDARHGLERRRGGTRRELRTAELQPDAAMAPHYRAAIDIFRLLPACFAALRGEAQSALPAGVVSYLRGRAGAIPADELAALPPGAMELLDLMREIHADNVRDGIRAAGQPAPKCTPAQRPTLRPAPRPAPRPVPRLEAPTFEAARPGDVSGDGLRVLFFRNDSLVQFAGTRAQLEAEGLIPAGFEWPGGRRRAYWSTGGQRFALIRCRPEGFKGPLRAWADADCWVLNCRGASPMDALTREVQVKRRELAQAIHRDSTAGRAEFHAQWEHAQKARGDARFQAMLSELLLLPAAKKPGRPPRAKADTALQAALPEGGAA